MFSRSDALFTDLLSDIGWKYENTTDLWPGITSTEVAKISLRKSFFKKLVERTSADADSKAASKFISVNERCSNWVMPDMTEFDYQIIGEVRKILYDFWYRKGEPLFSNHHTILDRGDLGPGSSIGAVGNSFYAKLFGGKLSCTREGLYLMYSDYIASFPTWINAEIQRSQRFGEAHVVEGSRFHFVPKSYDISRLICSEPTLNMMFQLGIGNILRDRLKEYFGIDLECQQEVNRELARLGSLAASDLSVTDIFDFATIDLESASDSLSIRMIELLFPRDLVTWLKLVRSPVGELEGKQVKLEMISTMGNGFTFPLQTLLFASVVAACAKCLEMPLVKASRRRDGTLVDPGNFSVFGDDIICHSLLARHVIRILGHLGFSVNKQKSFVEGPFRESCGSDWFYGQNVRGVYVKSLRSQQDLYVAINSLNLWTARTGVSLKRTVSRLLSWIKRPFWVPPSENLDAGILVNWTRAQKKGGLWTDSNDSILYRRFVSIPSYLQVRDSFFKYPKVRLKEHLYNPDGLYLCFLRGDIKNSKISVRLDRTRYSTKWSVTPGWDYAPTGTPVAGVTWRQWNSALHSNFG